MDTAFTYSSQPDVPPLVAPTADSREDIVYLDVWLAEADSSRDADLQNADDVQMQTSTRQKPQWVVRVAEGSYPDEKPGHATCILARLHRSPDGKFIDKTQIEDLRQRGLTLADVEQRASLLKSWLMPEITFVPQPYGGPGQKVKFFGRNFELGFQYVQFGNTLGNFDFPVRASEFTATIPEMAAGNYKVTIATAVGIHQTDFTVIGKAPPVVSTLSFTTGYPGQLLRITGVRFDVPNLKVTFALTQAFIQSATASEIIVQVPSLTFGLYDLKVTTDWGSAQASTPFMCTAGPPQLTSFTPSYGVAGTAVTLTGQNFLGENPRVLFGDIPANIGSVTPVQINLIAPSRPAGNVHISVITSTGIAVSTTQFSVLADAPAFSPSPNQFFPKAAIVGATVTIYGTNLAGPTPVVVKFNTVTTSPQIVARDYIVAVVPFGATTGKIYLSYAGGAFTPSVDDFTVLTPPTISSGVTNFPFVGYHDLTITIYGNFSGTVATTKVAFGNSIAIPLTVMSSQLTVKVPISRPRGPCIVTVITNTGSIECGDVFTVVASLPTVSGFAPASGTSGTIVTVNGSNFFEPNLLVTFVKIVNGLATGSYMAAIRNIPNSGTINVEVPVLTVGQYRLDVSNYLGSASSAGLFTV